MKHLSYVVFAVLLCVTTSAQAITLSWTQVTGANIPAGFVVNDWKGDFTDNVRGQAMLVRLTQGSLFQHPFGAPTGAPPNPALITPFPDLAFDSFLAAGNAVADPNTDPLIVGAAVDIPGSSFNFVFSTSGVDATWAPAPGRNTGPVTNFLLARITASNNAQGTWDVLSSDDSTGEVIVRASGPIINGAFVPEPTFGAIGIVLAMLLGRLRRS